MNSQTDFACTSCIRALLTLKMTKPCTR